MKYFVLGSMASGILLYGMSMIYGATGSLDLAEISQAIAGNTGNEVMLTFGLVFIVVGVAFKLGVVPFHMWLPDVYHGAPAPVRIGHHHAEAPLSQPGSMDDRAAEPFGPGHHGLPDLRLKLDPR